jgi:hypothetical protein
MRKHLLCSTVSILIVFLISCSHDKKSTGPSSPQKADLTWMQANVTGTPDGNVSVEGSITNNSNVIAKNVKMYFVFPQNTTRLARSFYMFNPYPTNTIPSNGTVSVYGTVQSPSGYTFRDLIRTYLTWD